MKRRSLWIGFLAAFLPLLLIVALQFWWLIKLEKTSAAAGKANLNIFLEAVTNEILYFYGPTAERALDVPPSTFTEDRPDRAAAEFRRKEVEGVRRLFIVRFASDETDTIWFYEHPYPPGYKSYSKTKPMRIEEFEPEKAWWTDREETVRAWKVTADDIAARGYNLDITNPNIVDDAHAAPDILLARYAEAPSIDEP